jgi:hypothetical protein
MPRAITVAAAISFLRIEVSPYSGSDLPSIENVWLRCRANELQISHEENFLELSKKMRRYISQQLIGKCSAFHFRGEHHRALALLLAAKSHTSFA